VVADVQQNIQAADGAKCQSGEIDGRVPWVFAQVSEGGKEVV